MEQAMLLKAFYSTPRRPKSRYVWSTPAAQEARY